MTTHRSMFLAFTLLSLSCGSDSLPDGRDGGGGEDGGGGDTDGAVADGGSGDDGGGEPPDGGGEADAFVGDGTCESAPRDLSEALPCALTVDDDELETGHVVGQVTADHARLWVDQRGSRSIRVAFRPLGRCSDEYRDATTMVLPAGDPDVTFAELDGLRPNTSYEYVVYSNDTPAGQGSFTTACPDLPTQVRYVFGSCSRDQGQDLDDDPSNDTRVWDDIMALDPPPALLILHGDTVYHDSGDYDRIFRINREHRRVPDFRRLVANLPTLAMWDDHDYGQNNGSSSFGGRETSLRAWSRLWPNAIFGPDAQADRRIYYRSRFGDLEFFFVDNRYHREAETYLGSEQMDWLIAGLEDSTATFKVVVHGGTIRRAGPESWFERSSSERDQLLDALRGRDGRAPITGVVFHGGDVHDNWFNPYPFCLNPERDTTYDAFEIVSSGLTYPRGSREGRWAVVDVDTTGDEPTLTYTFHEEGAPFIGGVIALQADGRQRHEWLGDFGDPVTINGDNEFLSVCTRERRGDNHFDALDDPSEPIYARP